NELTAIEEEAAEDRKEKRKEALETYLDLRRDLTDAVNRMVMGEREYALATIEQEYKDTVKYAEKQRDDKVISAEEANEMILDAGDKRRLSEEEAEREHAQRMMDSFFAVGQAVSNLFSQIGALAQTHYNNQLMMLDRETEANREALEERYEAEKEKIENSLMSEEEKDAALEALEEKKNKAIEKMDEDSEKKKKAIQKKAFESQKKISLVMAAINIAEAITKALTGAIPPFNLILAGLVTAAGAIQLAAIAAQKFPSAKEGAWVPRPMPGMAGHGPEGELIFPVHKLREIFAEAMETGTEAYPFPNRLYIDLTTIIGTERFKQSVVKVVNEASEERQLKIKHHSVVD
ncbi:MAG: hypothetical protein HWN51_03475, partial [Desulfobacterales bacterium]|nr:hypothetical protein [Desulfobacterales bacterium]